MKQPQPQSITSLPRSPDEERRSRMIKYLIANGTRVLCFILCFFAHGWWLLLPALAAVILPYVAVILANNSVPSRHARVLRPVVTTAAVLPAKDEFLR